MKRALGVTAGVLLFLATQLAALAGPLDNCAEYTRYGIPGDKGDLLCRTGYALAHNPQRKTPDWVAEHLTREKAIKSLPRSDDFRPDPDLEPGARAELKDYKGSGYARGHMAPAADMRWSKDAMSESFLLSNMAPQIGPGMNSGIWSRLEDRVREWAIKRGALYIYTGPIYAQEDPKTIGPGKVAVPTHLYKIVFDPVRVEAIAFIMENKSLKTADMPKYIETIDEIEEKTGLDFLSTLSDDVQKLVEAKKAVGLWE